MPRGTGPMYGQVRLELNQFARDLVHCFNPLGIDTHRDLRIELTQFDEFVGAPHQLLDQHQPSAR